MIKKIIGNLYSHWNHLYSHGDDPFSHSRTASEDVTSRVLDHTVLSATNLTHT